MTQAVTLANAGVQGSAKAWVNFNGVTTATINASYNVSSVTRNGTGDYTVNFTNAISDANYAVGITTNSGQVTGNQVIGAIYSSGGISSAPTLKTTTQLRISTQVTAQTFAIVDTNNCNVLIFR